MEDTKELIRAITRPILLILCLMASFVFQGYEMEGTFVTSLQYLTIAGISEWILERPFLKIAGKA